MSAYVRLVCGEFAFSHHQMVRLVVCTRGEVEVETLF